MAFGTSNSLVCHFWPEQEFLLAHISQISRVGAS